MTQAGGRWRLFRRLTFGWSASSILVAPLLLVGIAVGPLGLGVLSASVLSLLDPVVPVALAALGVRTGLGIAAGRHQTRPLIAIACLDAGLTTLIVTAGIVLASTSTPYLGSWVLALLVGLCAATSLTLPPGSPLEPRSSVVRVAELNVVLPIVAGGLLLAFLRRGLTLSAASLTVQAAVATAAIAVAGWLLLKRASSETEERVYAFGMLLLIGGVADYLSLSALLCGLVAGMFWRRLAGVPRESIGSAVSFVQHPLLVLVLLVAGARAEFSPASLGLAVAYVLLRAAGKLTSGALVRRWAPARVPPALGLHLLSPGVFGIALGLNVLRAAGTEASFLLSVVVSGTLASELLALLARPLEAAE